MMSRQKKVKILFGIIAVVALVLQIGFLTTQNPDKFPDSTDTSTIAQESENDVKESQVIVNEKSEINAIVNVSSKNLNLNESKFTVFVRLPKQYSVSDINPDSILCEGAHPVSVMTTDYGGSYFIAIFDLSELGKIAGENVTLSVTGELKDGTPFRGADVVTIT